MQIVRSNLCFEKSVCIGFNVLTFIDSYDVTWGGKVDGG